MTIPRYISSVWLIFLLLFESANISKFTPEDKVKYDFDMTTERDIHNQILYARKEGVKEGMEKGMEEGMEKGIEKGKEETAKEIALKMLAKGYPVEEIADVLNLTAEQIKAMK